MFRSLCQKPTEPRQLCRLSIAHLWGCYHACCYPVRHLIGLPQMTDLSDYSEN